MFNFVLDETDTSRKLWNVLKIQTFKLMCYNLEAISYELTVFLIQHIQH